MEALERIGHLDSHVCATNIFCVPAASVDSKREERRRYTKSTANSALVVGESNEWRKQRGTRKMTKMNSVLRFFVFERMNTPSEYV